MLRDPVLRGGLVSPLCGNLSGHLGMKGGWIRASYTSASQGQKAFPDRDRPFSAMLAYLRHLWCHRLRGDGDVRSQQVSTLGVPCNQLGVRVLGGIRETG